MLTRFEAEEAIRAIVGGAHPSEGNILIRGREGWKFENVPDPDLKGWLGILDADPSNPADKDMWFNSTDFKLKIQLGANRYESTAFTLAS